jgi:hypothetical protein
MDAYGTVEGAAAYHAARGRTVEWAAVDDPDAALLVASE